MNLRNLVLLSIFQLCFQTANILAAELSCNYGQEQVLSKDNEEFIKWIDSIPNSIPAEDLCETVEVIKTEKFKNQETLFYGQGSVFNSLEEPGKIFILTAAHVAANGTKLEAKCGDKIFKVKLRGISQTKDLAVLEFEEIISEVKPLFTWSKEKLPVAEVRAKLASSDEDYIPSGAHYIQTSKEFVNKNDLHLVRDTKQGMKLIPNRYTVETELVTDPSKHPLVGSKTALLLTREGIRPGMSGSPIIYSTKVLNPKAKNESQLYINKNYLSAVLLKTYINDTQSIAVPIETINEALPLLLQGKDPAKLKQSQYFFEKKITTKDSKLLLVPTVTFLTENGNEEIQSVCPSPFSNSSGKAGTGDSTGKAGTGDSTGKSGTGDSTGKAGTGDSTGKAGTGDSTGKAGTGDSTGNKNSTNSLYRDYYNCKEAGIRDSKGNVYLAVVKDDGTIIKAETIEDVSDLIQKYGSKFPEFLRGHGLTKKNSDEMYKRLCSNEDIFNNEGKSTRIKISQRDFDPKNLDVANYQRITEVPHGKKFGDTKMEVSCTKLNKSIIVQITKGDLKINLNMSPDSWNGAINFQGCKASFNTQPISPWFLALKDKNLDFQISLSPDQSFLNVDVLSANSKCLEKKKDISLISLNEKPTPPAEVWLSKIAISLSHTNRAKNNIVDLEEDEQKLFEIDEKLNNEALKWVESNPSKAMNIISQLNQNKLTELEKGRSGKPVSEQRILRIKSMINLIKSKLAPSL